MLGVKMMRQNFSEIKAGLQTRGVREEILAELLRLDESCRDLLVKVGEMKKYQSDASAEIAQLRRNKEDATTKIAEMKEVGDNIKALDAEINAINEELHGITATLPNLPGDSVSVGAGEEENVEVRHWDEPRTFAFGPKPHWEVTRNLDILDFERGAKVAGSRFVYHKGLSARLERALYNFMLDLHVYEHGYTEMITPYIVDDTVIFKTGQSPKFKEDIFQLQDTDLTLTPTAEIPLTNYYDNEILDSKDLPIYFTALSPSFCSEAGSAGRDARGLIRLHQFNKVKMVRFSDTEHSYEELEKMTNNTEEILQKLGLPYRVMALSTGDIGLSAAGTCDLKVWTSAQEIYHGISSHSNYEDFQAHRAVTRYHDENDKIQYAHILNGSGLTVGRTVVAILGNYQNEDDSVAVPEVLVPYMGSLTAIEQREDEGHCLISDNGFFSIGEGAYNKNPKWFLLQV